MFTIDGRTAFLRGGDTGSLPRIAMFGRFHTDAPFPTSICAGRVTDRERT